MPKIPMVAIVDDDEAIRTSTANLMRSFGFAANLFASGEELLHSPRLAHACCVITDVQMPGMNGLELQTLLLARGHTVPVILITAYPDERTRQNALAAGAAGFFYKPFDAAAMIQCIADTLVTRKQAGMTPS